MSWEQQAIFCRYLLEGYENKFLFESRVIYDSVVVLYGISGIHIKPLNRCISPGTLRSVLQQGKLAGTHCPCLWTSSLVIGGTWIFYLLLSLCT